MSFQASETTTMLSAAPMQMSHWLPLSSTVSRIRWKKPSSVANTIAAADINDVVRKRRSANVSRLNTLRSASRAVNEKNGFASPKVVMPIARASCSPSSCSAPAITARVAAQRGRRRRTGACRRA
jgi:hypothetical protein